MLRSELLTDSPFKGACYSGSGKQKKLGGTRDEGVVELPEAIKISLVWPRLLGAVNTEILCRSSRLYTINST